MRGKIIQYNGVDGTGTIAAEGRQHRFSIGTWKSDSVPAVGATVDVVIENDEISAVTAAAGEALLRERTAELGGMISSLASRINVSGGSADGATLAGSVVERYGIAVLVSYILFVLGTLAFNAVVVSAFGNSAGKSLFDVAGAMSQMGGGGGGGIKAMLLLSYVSIVTPLLWHDRRAWFALVVPLLAVLWAVADVLHMMSKIPSGYGNDISNMFSIGLGAYLSAAAAIVLTVGGVKRFMRGA
jgi:hypothetical protein